MWASYDSHQGQTTTAYPLWYYSCFDYTVVDGSTPLPPPLAKPEAGAKVLSVSVGGDNTVDDIPISAEEARTQANIAEDTSATAPNWAIIVPALAGVVGTLAVVGVVAGVVYWRRSKQAASLPAAMSAATVGP